MIFESLPTTPRSDELIDKAFSRAARSGRAKQNKLEAQQSMLQTASNILSDNLENVVVEWPDFELVDPFYGELADAVVAQAVQGYETDTGETIDGVDAIRKSLSEIMWASRQIDNISREYQPKLRKTDADLARKHRKQAFARMASVVEEVEDDLLFVGAARDALKNLPDIRPDEPAIVVAGYPNVGKSSFVNTVTRASNEIARYPFTTKGVQIGHFDRNRIRYQIIDTPGLLDRPEDERNDIERQAVSALEHLGDAVIFVADASEECGYPIESQLELRDAVQARFEERNIPVLTVCNKSDRSTDMEADLYMSVETGENVDAVLDAAADAVGFDPDIPPSRNE
ncbi:MULTISPECIES: GTPase [Haloferax]|uniref:GTP-binding protein n=2 Tax=Haloferax TaxID=2251 RepID=A0A6G1Z0H5_9EURY|nr:MULTISPECIES: GTPase [Haloferax]KAB1187375.1 GTP-binding protein [Haloferax sp. CBA1149]MRW80022.1 GTP-binding protein [Haloferax marinisediminis]